MKEEDALGIDGGVVSGDWGSMEGGADYVAG